jgi:N-methylhydantoinase A
MEYGVSSNDIEAAFVSLSVTGTSATEAPPPTVISNASADPLKSERRIFFDNEWFQCKVWDGHRLQADFPIEGPCIIEFDHACAVLPPQTVAKTYAYGNLLITV